MTTTLASIALTGSMAVVSNCVSSNWRLWKMIQLFTTSRCSVGKFVVQQFHADELCLEAKSIKQLYIHTHTYRHTRTHIIYCTYFFSLAVLKTTSGGQMGEHACHYLMPAQTRQTVGKLQTFQPTRLCLETFFMATTITPKRAPLDKFSRPRSGKRDL